jgi:hypothetical protein
MKSSMILPISFEFLERENRSREEKIEQDRTTQ